MFAPHHGRAFARTVPLVGPACSLLRRPHDVVHQPQMAGEISQTDVALYSAWCGVRAQALEALGRQGGAVKWYRAAVFADPRNYEALAALFR